MAAVTDLFPECRSGPLRLRFDAFLERVLYHPEHGYYCRPGFRIGRMGDFYTAPHVHSLFAEILAEQFLDWWEQAGRPPRFTLLEMGPGDATLALQILACIERRFPEFYSAARYIGLEASAALARQQRERLARFAGARIDCGRGAAGIEPFEGCIFSNEFFDALPFRRFKRGRTRWLEQFVEVRPEGVRGRWTTACWDAGAGVQLASGSVLEWREGFEDFYRLAVGCLRRGRMLHFDYGERRENLDRRGTLRTFYRHRLGEQPFVRLGEQDITASVDFSHLIELGDRHGFRSRLAGQRCYLIERGILEKIALRFHNAPLDDPRTVEEKLAVKDLIVPGGISDHFKVLIQERS
ncbi:MAG: SAM-dependent methyltransferase [Acidobacteria bacterium]|nr:SAM-dependent methyltransferase [Acidobacteriota bacterium]